MIDEGATRLGGRLPVNPSGGLLRKGHPVGATGLAQITELTEQLRGSAGPRQVEGARIGMAQNGGGSIGNDAAAMAASPFSSANPFRSGRLGSECECFPLTLGVFP